MIARLWLPAQLAARRGTPAVLIALSVALGWALCTQALRWGLSELLWPIAALAIGVIVLFAR